MRAATPTKTSRPARPMGCNFDPALLEEVVLAVATEAVVAALVVVDPAAVVVAPAAVVVKPAAVVVAPAATVVEAVTEVTLTTALLAAVDPTAAVEP